MCVITRKYKNKTTSTDTELSLMDRDFWCLFISYIMIYIILLLLFSLTLSLDNIYKLLQPLIKIVLVDKLFNDRTYCR